jgi:S-phase kinase-associated protein 1
MEGEVDTENAQVKLISKQHDVFEVNKEVAFMFLTVKDMIEEVGSEDPIRLSLVDSDTLALLIEFAKYQNNARDESLSEDEVKDWCGNFIVLDDNSLFRLILASNYLNIKALLDLGCKQVADEIRGKTPEEIRVRFNIKNDFTPEEEEEVRRENAWCEER